MVQRRSLAQVAPNAQTVLVQRRQVMRRLRVSLVGRGAKVPRRLLVLVAHRAQVPEVIERVRVSEVSRSCVQLLRLGDVRSGSVVTARYEPVLVQDAEVVERERVTLRGGLLVPEGGGAVVHAEPASCVAAVVQRAEVILSLGESRVGGGPVPPRRDHRILRDAQAFLVEVPEVTLRLPVAHVRRPLVVGERGREVPRRLRARANRVDAVGVSHRGAPREPTLGVLLAPAAPLTIAETRAEAVHRGRVGVGGFRSLQVQQERLAVGLVHEKFFVPHGAQLCPAIVRSSRHRGESRGRGTRARPAWDSATVSGLRGGRGRLVVAALHRDAPEIPVGRITSSVVPVPRLLGRGGALLVGRVGEITSEARRRRLARLRKREEGGEGGETGG
mmetsp:Transcript_9877/g.38536  ORF Transcript_9877/g.38536 Transcript_9877/m.38536 type:complete len:388 (-) Transcript_9877:180-1343(-)